MNNNIDDMTQILLDAFFNKFLTSLEENCHQNQTISLIKEIIHNLNFNITDNNNLLKSKYDIIDRLKMKTFNEIKEINDIINETIDENKSNPDMHSIIMSLNRIKTLSIEFVINRNEELYDFFHE